MLIINFGSCFIHHCLLRNFLKLLSISFASISEIEIANKKKQQEIFSFTFCFYFNTTTWLHLHDVNMFPFYFGYNYKSHPDKPPMRQQVQNDGKMAFLLFLHKCWCNIQNLYY